MADLMNFSLTPQGLDWFWHRNPPSPLKTSFFRWNFQERCTWYESDVESVVESFGEMPAVDVDDYWQEEENEWSSELDLCNDCDYELDS